METNNNGKKCVSQAIIKLSDYTVTIQAMINPPREEEVEEENKLAKIMDAHKTLMEEHKILMEKHKILLEKDKKFEEELKQLKMRMSKFLEMSLK